MRKNARFKIFSYFCGVMNKQYLIISLKKEILVSCFLMSLFFLEGGNCYASEQQLLRGTIETPSDNYTVRGRVIDVYGEPLIGATIREKGGANGTVTDIDGRFFLSVPDSAVLQVSFGMSGRMQEPTSSKIFRLWMLRSSLRKPPHRKKTTPQ